MHSAASDGGERGSPRCGDSKQRMIDNLDIVSSEPSLRSKRELIEKFVHQGMTGIGANESLSDAFKSYWEAARKVAVQALRADGGIERPQLDHLMKL